MLSRPAYILLSILAISSTVNAQGPQGYFNGSAFVILRNTLSPQERISFSFRTCSSGQLLYQKGRNENFFSVSVRPQGDLEVKWKNDELENKVHFGTNLSNSRWHYVDFTYRLGLLTLDIDSNSILLANSTYNNDIFRINLEEEVPKLYVGQNFSGCLLQGANIILSNLNLLSSSVLWNICPLLEDCSSLCNLAVNSQCQNGGTCIEDKLANRATCICKPQFVGDYCETLTDLQYCDSSPCQNGGSCIINQPRNGYKCICRTGFSGNNCESYIDHCRSKVCKNGGTCIDERSSYTCSCDGTGYHGANCEVNINECEDLHPCMNGGSCYDRYGDYMCHCQPGYRGKNCEDDINECISSPCKNGGTCLDLQDRYECSCLGGFTGINCELSIGICVNMACQGNSTCISGMNHEQCICSSGFTGTYPNCSEINECDSSPCQNGGTCSNKVNGFHCSCQQGFTGLLCEQEASICYPNPCHNGGRCFASSQSYSCICAYGYSGRNCEISSGGCSSNPCVQANSCQDLVNDYLCDCLPGWEGKNCDQNVDDCFSQPCLHGSCVDHLNNYSCVCQPGYSGYNCDINIDDCESQPCQNGGTCEDLVNDFRCYCMSGFMGKLCSEQYGALLTSLGRSERCLEGFSGSNCSVEIDHCLSNPCVNGSCHSQPGNYTCVCSEGITGTNCDDDIDECNSEPCQNGICKNTYGSYLCYCRPGYTGHQCHIEFDECLSSPCQNNGTCWNEISNYRCACVPGFTGRNCETDIDECLSQPCINGGTCQDRINNYMCRCMPGYSGINCEINIDECASSPCLHDGQCVDSVNEYHCDCLDTGFAGEFCEINIDDCQGNPCQHGSKCTDRIKDYGCACPNGFSGKNCEIDFPDCASNPCQNNATCLENSNQTLYDINYLGLFPLFSYDEASGYKCICLRGFTGSNCEINIDDCEGNNCVNGTCLDGINHYVCQCSAGFEDKFCDKDIDECQKFMPCQNGGTCRDMIADYSCQCPPEFGGKNCSIELLGCRTNYCENGATCVPYLGDNDYHQYHCNCPLGYFGEHCRIITTASFGSHSLTPAFWRLAPRERITLQQYILAFQFRTTLQDGLLASGTTGESGYLLYLRDSAVQLTFYRNNTSTKTVSSQSGVNDAQWRDLVLFISQDGVILNVSGEIKKESIIFNTTSFAETSISRSPSIVATSFPSAFDIPNFIGCVREVKVNNQLIIPDNNSLYLVGARVGCDRTEQCNGSTCLNGGKCVDHWDTHVCICPRLFFGEQCQYSYSPATFGVNDTIAWSVVNISEDDREYINHFVNIGLVFRTRKDNGLLFDLTEVSSPSGQYNVADPSSLKAFIEDSRVYVEFKGSTPIPVTFNKKVDDGEYHFLNVSFGNMSLQVALNNSQKSVNVSSTEHLSPDMLFIGSYPAAHIMKHQTVHSSETARSSERIGSSRGFDGHFKGIIKDMKVNNKTVAFFPLGVSNESDLPPILNVTNHNVREGLISDDPCSIYSPCENGAKCTDAWNDYHCECPEDYRGKNCSELQPCAQNSTCPSKSKCHNLDNGYECVAAAAFNGSSEIEFFSNISTSIINITFLYRTLDGGVIVSINNSDNIFVVEISESLQLNWKNQSAAFSENASSPDINMTNGEWHSIQLIFSEENVTVWSNNTVLSLTHNIPFHVILDSDTRIIVGHSHDNDSKGFKGCIEEIRLNQILLPFASYGSTDKVNFHLHYNTSEMGCILCWDRGCENGRHCESKENSFNCNCGNRYKGRYCDYDICKEKKPCKNGGSCVFDNKNDIECDCGNDYKGTYCEVMVEHCLRQPCQNGGTCYDLRPGFNCTCTEIYEGKLCNISKIKDCRSNPCKNGATCIDKELDFNYTMFSCICHRGFTGITCENPIDFCQNNPCRNGGTCMSEPLKASFHCNCPPEYTGRTCDTENDECLSGPCIHGKCQSSFRNYSCICNHGYMGDNCERQITSCSQKPDVCNFGNCTDANSSYSCICSEGFFGKHCSLRDPCHFENSCNKNEICIREGDEDQNVTSFTCKCDNGCEITSASGNDNVAIIVGIIIGCIFFLCIFIAVVMFLRVAKKKRATRGTYSPSRQEMYGSRVEMNHVMKPPPEERLI